MIKTKVLKLGSTMRVVEFNAAVTRVKSDVTKATRTRLHATVAAVFRWALSIPAVQQEIADAFDGSTPMCRVMRDAINQSMDHHREIEADDVNGLGRYMEEAVEEAFRNFEVDADDVKHLDQVVQSIIEDNTKEIAETVSEHLVISVGRR